MNKSGATKGILIGLWLGLALAASSVRAMSLEVAESEAARLPSPAKYAANAAEHTGTTATSARRNQNDHSRNIR